MKIYRSDYDDIAAKYKSGLSMQEVAYDYNCSKYAIMTALKNMGIKPSEGGIAVRMEKDRGKVLKLLKEGYTKKYIAHHLHMHIATVFKYQKYFREQGIL